MSSLVGEEYSTLLFLLRFKLHRPLQDFFVTD